MSRVVRSLMLAAILVLTAALLFGCGGTASQGDGDQRGAIVGIEPGAGIMKATEEAIDAYDLNFDLKDSSSSAMAAALKKAVQAEDWIVVTGWTPHWKFATFDLKYLDDPENVFGGEEQIVTLARQGFKEDNPAAYDILDSFYWEPADMEAVMLLIEGGADPEEAAAQWVEENEAKAQAWLSEDVDGAGEKVVLGYVEWDSEISSTHVIKHVLEQAGFEVEAIAVDVGILFTGLSKGDFDATVSCWLPATHSDYYESAKDKIDTLGPNLDGAKIGLVVPTYVTIDSIEELNEHAAEFK